MCDAWAEPLRASGTEVTSVRIYSVVQGVRPEQSRLRSATPRLRVRGHRVTGALTRPVAVLDGWLFAPETAGRVRVMRLLLAALIGLRLATGPHRGLAAQPAALFRPVWFLSWMDQMPSVGVLVAIQVVGVLGATAGRDRMAGARDVPPGLVEPDGARRTASLAAGRSSTTTSSCSWSRA